MDDDLVCSQQLCMHGGWPKPGKRPQCLEAGHDVGACVGVQRAASALMSRVERSEHLAHLGATHLTHDETIGPHAQRLAHQGGEPDGTLTFDVGRA